MRLTPSRLREILLPVYALEGTAWVALMTASGEVLEALGHGPPDEAAPAAATLRALGGLPALDQGEAGTWLHDPHPEPRGVHAHRVGADWLLVVVFDSSLSSLGAVREQSVPAAARIDMLLLEA